VLATAPVVQALSDGGVDASVTEMFSVSLASGTGVLSGTLSVPAVAGVATYDDLIYTAAVDGESFALQVHDQAGVGPDFPAATSAAVASDVVATALSFTTQPEGEVSGVALTTQPVVTAVDGAGTVDTDYVAAVDLSLATGAGTSSTLTSSRP
jgi:large repetitive protein